MHHHRRTEDACSHQARQDFVVTRQTVNPPETSITAPLMYDASSEARNAYTFATSSGVPRRRKGTRSVSCSRTFCGIVSRMWVAIKPGATALHRIPFGPNSRAQVLTKPMTPNLLAA